MVNNSLKIYNWNFELTLKRFKMTNVAALQFTVWNKWSVISCYQWTAVELTAICFCIWTLYLHHLIELSVNTLRVTAVCFWSLHLILGLISVISWWQVNSLGAICFVFAFDPIMDVCQIWFSWIHIYS